MPKYLNKENRSEVSAKRVGDYPLPYDPDLLVRVQSLPMARMNRYSEAAQAGGERARVQTYQLIADSIVDENGERVWESGNIQKELADADCRLVSALIKIIGQHNGGNDQEIEEMVKNSSETE